MLANLFDAFAIYIACTLAVIQTIYVGSVLPNDMSGNSLWIIALVSYVLFVFISHRGLRLLASVLRR